VNNLEYSFVHQGHCAAGHMPPGGPQATLYECVAHCQSRGAGYMAYHHSNTDCHCYTANAGCPDDYHHNDYIAYQLPPTTGDAALLAC
jgi:hypothetical protein